MLTPKKIKILTAIITLLALFGLFPALLWLVANKLFVLNIGFVWCLIMVLAVDQSIKYFSINRKKHDHK